eukprot:759588-Hanusia_phi.AAC.1
MARTRWGEGGRTRMMMAGGAFLFSLLLISSWRSKKALHSGEKVVLEDTPCDGTGIEDCKMVKKFDPKAIYSSDANIDLDHPNRVDFYGDMFQNFPQGQDTLMTKVLKLKKKLASLARKQKKFMEKLDHPPPVTISVLPGEVNVPPTTLHLLISPFRSPAGWVREEFADQLGPQDTSVKQGRWGVQDWWESRAFPERWAPWALKVLVVTRAIGAGLASPASKGLQ